MPKIIEHLREDLLAQAREVLLQGGGQTLTIRSLAARCGVAPGTVYNYFRSKDDLTAHVMLEDWLQALRLMAAGTAQAPDALAGLQCVYRSIAGFVDTYRAVWANYASTGDPTPVIRQRHGLLIAQLNGVIVPLLQRFHALWTPGLADFLAETLLSAAGKDNSSFDNLSPILARLIQPA